MHNLNHPNVVRMFVAAAISDAPDSPLKGPAIVMELVALGDLRSFVMKRYALPLSQYTSPSFPHIGEGEAE